MVRVEGGEAVFGYVITNHESLPQERQQRFRAFYCGLCGVLQARHGFAGSATLSYDLTFLAVLLNALYEEGERSGHARCLPHPLKRHDYIETPQMAYVADMNVALAYHKCLDNWLDDRSVPSAAEAKLLERAYRRVEQDYPGKCRAIEKWLDEIHAIEGQGLEQIDPPVNSTGRMLGELFTLRPNDPWAPLLREVGDGLGRFIYFMDAYEDLPEDFKKRRYNPLKAFHERPDYEEMCKSVLTMMIADATSAFEQLPILLDADILRNILYSGVWSKYAYLQKKREARQKGER